MSSKRFIFTQEQIDYIKSIAEGKYIHEITDLFNVKFGLNKTTNQLAAMKKNHRIRSNVPPRAIGLKGILFSEKEEEYLKINVVGRNTDDLAKMFNTDFDRQIKPKQLQSWKKRNKIKSGVITTYQKGNVPWITGKKGVTTGGESSWFKKGHTPHNTLPIGSERFVKDGYVEVKTAEPSTWELKHRMIYQDTYGPIFRSDPVIFADGNKQNFNSDNLVLITKSELARMNRLDLFSDDPALTKAGVNLVRLRNKIIDMEVYEGKQNDFDEYIKIAEQKGINEVTLRARLHNGWSLQDAISKEVTWRKKRTNPTTD